MKFRIILLVDLEKAAHAIIKNAGSWASMLGANLTIVYQIPGVVPALTDAELRDNILNMEKEYAQNSLESIVAKAIGSLRNINIIVTEKSLPVTIKQILTDRKPTFIMLGIVKKGLLSKIFLGSVSSKILDFTNDVLIALPAEGNFYIPHKMIIGIKKDVPLNIEKLKMLIQAFHHLITHIDILSIADKETSEQTMSQLNQVLRTEHERAIVSEVYFQSENVKDKINEYVTGQKEAVLVLQRGGRSLLDELFRKYTINEIIESGNFPIIILP